MEKWPFFIAEIGVNHEGCMIKAKEMINQAHAAGASAVKFQTYKASKIASKTSPSYWDLNEESTTSQFDLFTKYDSFGENEYQELAQHSKNLGIEFMSTAFDHESLEFINELVNYHKISSSDITNRPLIERIASKNKPIILSVGASDETEIKEALSWIQNKVPVALLHCVLQYPTPNEDANLGQIVALKKIFNGYTIGYSDHTKPQNGKILQIATCLGAKIIEKHFTFDKTLTGNDHYHSFDQQDLSGFLDWHKTVYSTVFGNGEEICFNRNESIARMNARRGVYSAKEIIKGSTISESDIICKRPYTGGIHPRKYFNLIGKKALQNINEDEPLEESFFE